MLALFKRRTAANSLQFLELAIEEFPFPIQRIQTDRGREFFAYCFQEKLMEYGIKFRPIKPASPHLNGKVERSQRTDIEEFYATADLKAPDLSASTSGMARPLQPASPSWISGRPYAVAGLVRTQFDDAVPR